MPELIGYQKALFLSPVEERIIAKHLSTGIQHDTHSPLGIFITGDNTRYFVPELLGTNAKTHFLQPYSDGHITVWDLSTREIERELLPRDMRRVWFMERDKVGTAGFLFDPRIEPDLGAIFDRLPARRFPHWPSITYEIQVGLSYTGRRVALLILGGICHPRKKDDNFAAIAESNHTFLGLSVKLVNRNSRLVQRYRRAIA